MTDRQKLYDGISKCAWAYLFLYFDVNFGKVSLLPDFAAFHLFLGAIELMQEQERELTLLRPLGKMLMLWHGLKWGLSWFGADPDGLIPGLDIVICLANLYFHFQLLTNLSAIAQRSQAEGADHGHMLLVYRTMQTVLFTVMMVSSYLAPLLGEAWGYVSTALGAGYLIAGVFMMAALFEFRRQFSVTT